VRIAALLLRDVGSSRGTAPKLRLPGAIASSRSGSVAPRRMRRSTPARATTTRSAARRRGPSDPRTGRRGPDAHRPDIAPPAASPDAARAAHVEPWRNSTSAIREPRRRVAAERGRHGGWSRLVQRRRANAMHAVACAAEPPDHRCPPADGASAARAARRWLGAKPMAELPKARATAPAQRDRGRTCVWGLRRCGVGSSGALPNGGGRSDRLRRDRGPGRR
jgi:hypothetical protein